MILKCKSIAHIHNSIGYILLPEKNHEFVKVDGLDMTSKNSIIADFNLFNNQKVKNGFVSLVISPSRKDKLTTEQFKDLVGVTLKELGLENRQYFAVTHNNTKTPHCHVILNRISYDNKTWNDHHIAWKCKEASARVAKALNLESARNREKQLNALRKEIRFKLRECLHESLNLTDFKNRCDKKGIRIKHVQNKNGSIGSRIYYGDESFKVSEIDRIIGFQFFNGLLVPNEKLNVIFESNERKMSFQNRFRKNISDDNLTSLRKFFREFIHNCTSLPDLFNQLEQHEIKVHQNEALKNELQLSYRGQYFTSMDLSDLFQFKLIDNELVPAQQLQKVFRNNTERIMGSRNDTDILNDLQNNPQYEEDYKNELLVWYKNQLSASYGLGQKFDENDDENEEMMKRKRRKRRELGRGL